MQKRKETKQENSAQELDGLMKNINEKMINILKIKPSTLQDFYMYKCEKCARKRKETE